MSMKKVKEILDRAHRDKRFRDQLLSNPENTLQEYKLPSALVNKIAKLDAKKLDHFHQKMERRLAKDGSVAFSEDDFWVESVTD